MLLQHGTRMGSYARKIYATSTTWKLKDCLLLPEESDHRSKAAYDLAGLHGNQGNAWSGADPWRLSGAAQSSLQ